MTKAVEFFFDVGSPASYLAWTQLPTLCEQAGARLVYRPMLLGGIFQATGNSSPASVPAKGRYVTTDLARHARRYGVALAHNPHFPILTLSLMRAAVGVQLRQPERLDDYLSTVFRALWVDALDLNDAGLVAQTLAGRDFVPELVAQWVSDPEVKAALKANTDEALQRGVFGAPTMFVGTEMYFGQDRLDFVREALV
ncbi:2-hydroxychromene-2-carboxylate isomerase [Cupriavidus yeoncheonensis]|uniref:2-hydroxychromene-2-carboxylate isomerase n=1 Tax=Cupriavidus yeoncheonensis TaxID=1462994 RepID=A0A916IPN8_9BURK|nr:2-hydroxychromene-2-carboxylate isomerase [Cupriavidus yeoncheonensis]CAG2132078.1 2-hydroxychromene-2-carboxylate isomerase [Cupriavidus yeoncheonensis]